MSNDSILGGLDKIAEGLAEVRSALVGSNPTAPVEPVEPVEPPVTEPDTKPDTGTDTTPPVVVPPKPPVGALPGQIGHPENWWNTTVRDHAAAPNSAEIVKKLQTATEAWHDWGLDGSGSNFWLPKLDLNMKHEEPYGHHINYVTDDHRAEYRVPTEYTLDGPYDPHYDYLQVPYSAEFNLQNFGDSTDSHLYVVDERRRELREYYHVRNYGTDKMTTGAATIYPLDTIAADRGLGCSSSNASGSVYAPMLITPDDMARGEINHAIGLTLSNSIPEGHKFITPGQHTPLQYNTGGFMPYGARFRLRADFDVSKVKNRNARTILTALQNYGFFHIDGINARPLVPCTNDRGFENKWRTVGDMSPHILFFDPALPTWEDFEMLDGEIHDMRDVRCEREQRDERQMNLNL